MPELFEGIAIKKKEKNFEMERKFNKTESSSPQLPDQLVKLLWKIGQSRSVHHECIV